MKILVTGAGGLVGSAVSEISARLGHDVIAVDNNFRGHYLSGDVTESLNRLRIFGNIEVVQEDINRVAFNYVREVDAVVHCAGQPSHDFSVQEPQIDAEANIDASLAILHSHRNLRSRPKLVFLSTNKVYGDLCNNFKYKIFDDRYHLTTNFAFGNDTFGFDETFPIVSCARTPFGASKLAADFMFQEWAHTYGAHVAVFRCGCITGSTGTPVEMHGFLGYLAKCAVIGKDYTVYGHAGYQVRDNVAAVDLASAILHWLERPSRSIVYNMGGGNVNSLSVREAVDFLRELGCEFTVNWDGPPRFADHMWWITNTARFERDYPSWRRQIGVREVLREMVECERCGGVASMRNEAVPSSVVEEIRLQLQQGRAPSQPTGLHDAASRDLFGGRHDGGENARISFV